MQKRYWISITSLRSRVLFSWFFSFCTTLHAANGVMPIDNTEIELADGRWVIAQRNGELSHCLIVKAKGKTEILSLQCFEQEPDRLWQYAFFIPVKRASFVSDIDNNGSLEIGVATWDGGNKIDDRYALIFSLKNNRLQYYGRKKFNLENGEYLFK